MSLKKKSFMIIDNKAYIFKGNESLTDIKGNIKLKYGGFSSVESGFLYVKEGSLVNQKHLEFQLIILVSYIIFQMFIIRILKTLMLDQIIIKLFFLLKINLKEVNMN